jgi:hypothetical protein
MPAPYLTFENFPEIPEDIIKEIYECAETQPNFFVVDWYPMFKTYRATEKILEWTNSVFKFPHNAHVQVIYGDLYIHTDIERTFAINYILETGGDNVQTCFYDEKNILLEKYVVQEKQWAKLDVTVPHNVINVKPNSRRIGLSVCDIQPIATKAELVKRLRVQYNNKDPNGLQSYRPRK